MGLASDWFSNPPFSCWMPVKSTKSDRQSVPACASTCPLLGNSPSVIVDSYPCAITREPDVMAGAAGPDGNRNTPKTPPHMLISGQPAPNRAWGGAGNVGAAAPDTAPPRPPVE